MRRKRILKVAGLLFVVILALLMMLGLTADYTSAPLWSADCTNMQPAAPATMPPDAPKIVVTVATAHGRTWGYRIGEVICVEMTVTVPPGAQVNFDTLRAEVLVRATTDFTMAQPPQITSATVGTNTVWTVDMVVEFWAKNPGPFTAEFLYSTRTLTDLQPNWEYMATPAIQFGYSPTAPDHADTNWMNMQGGPMEDASYPVQPLGWAMIGLGSLMVLGVLSWLFQAWWRKRHQPRLPQDRELFWATVARITASSHDSQWQEMHYRDLSVEFRRYLKCETVEPSPEQYPEHFETITKILAVFRQALYADASVSQEQHDQLLAWLEIVIPRTVQPKPSMAAKAWRWLRSKRRKSNKRNADKDNRKRAWIFQRKKKERVKKVEKQNVTTAQEPLHPAPILPESGRRAHSMVRILLTVFVCLLIVSIGGFWTYQRLVPTQEPAIIYLTQSNAQAVSTRLAGSKLPLFFEMCKPEDCVDQNPVLNTVALHYKGQINFVEFNPADFPQLPQFQAAQTLLGETVYPSALFATGTDVFALGGVHSSGDIQSFIESSLHDMTIRVTALNAQAVGQYLQSSMSKVSVLFIVETSDIYKQQAADIEAAARSYAGNVLVIVIDPFNAPNIAPFPNVVQTVTQQLQVPVYPAYLFVNANGAAMPYAGMLNGNGLSQLIQAGLALKPKA